MATDNITANGQSKQWEVGPDITNMALHCAGTFSNVNVSFEGSCDGTNWFATEAVRSAGSVTETTSGLLSAAPAYSWDIACGGYSHVRVRSTAWTSGSQRWTVNPYRGGTDAALNVSMNAGATVVNTPAVPTQSNVNSAASTNATVIKGSAGTVYGVVASNVSGSARFVKLYNKATAPTVGTDVPVIVIPLAANTSVFLPLGELGMRFSLGIGLAITGLAADTDTTVVGASEVKVATAYQ